MAEKGGNLPFPEWASFYVGIPFVVHGRDRVQGVDCWGLVRMVYADRYGIDLPSWADAYDDLDDRRGIAAVVTDERRVWRVADRPAEGDVILMRAGDLPHVGVWLTPRRMLHTRERVGARVGFIGGEFFAVEGVFRHVGR
ncbi:NlpC/P60 family protein [Tistrella bauzanensis]